MLRLGFAAVPHFFTETHQPKRERAFGKFYFFMVAHGLSGDTPCAKLWGGAVEARQAHSLEVVVFDSHPRNNGMLRPSSSFLS